MSDHEIAELTGPKEGLSPERIEQLERRLPEYQARDQYENGYLKGLEMAAELLDEELPGDAAAKVRELLAVAASRIHNDRPQVHKLRAEAMSSEFREWMEAESEKILSGQAQLMPAEDLLRHMEGIIQAKQRPA